jgi:hypothetical protein
MTKFDIIKEIFTSREVTITKDNRAYLRIKNKIYELPFNIVSGLIRCSSLQEDSGNLETGEIHYRFVGTSYLGWPLWGKKVEQLLPVLREIRLDNLIDT